MAETERLTVQGKLKKIRRKLAALEVSSSIMWTSLLYMIDRLGRWVERERERERERECVYVCIHIYTYKAVYAILKVRGIYLIGW